jgi:Flp pilus assembly protein TadG
VARLAKNLRRRGVSTVEAAIVLSLLIFPLTFGLIEYGWMFYNSQFITNTARQAARLASLPDSTSADVQAAITDMMTKAGLGDSGYAPPTLSPEDVTSAKPGESVTVTLVVPTTKLRLTGFPLPMPDSLKASVTMAKEGP